KSLEGMEWLIDLQRTTRAINVTDPGFEAFLQGRAAMARAVNPNVAHWLLPFPGHERQIQEVITHGFMISAGTKYPDEAWNFVKWVTLGDGALFFASMGQNPARTDSHLWNEWLIASSNWNFSDISGLMPNIGDGTNTQPTIPG